MASGFEAMYSSTDLKSVLAMTSAQVVTILDDGFGVAVARNYGYSTVAMHVSVADAKNQLSQLIRAVEAGEEVIITRSGKPVVQMTRARQEQRTVQLGALRGRIQLKPGWDAPMTEDEFLAG